MIDGIKYKMLQIFKKFLYFSLQNDLILNSLYTVSTMFKYIANKILITSNFKYKNDQAMKIFAQLVQFKYIPTFTVAIMA